MGLQLYVLDRFTPKEYYARPSYRTVKDFYDLISRHNSANAVETLLSAWTLTSDDMHRNRWQGDVERFLSGFRNTKGLDLMAIAFVASPSPYTDTYIVYYEDDTESPMIAGLDDLGEWKVSEVPKLAETIDSVRATLKKKGIDSSVLDNMKLSELMFANRGDMLRHNIENAVGLNKADEIFARSQRVKRLIAKSVVVRRDANTGKWLIDSIDTIAFNKDGGPSDLK